MSIVMEAVYDAVRANLRRLMGLYPQWTHQQYAQAVGMSLGWVKKGKKRLQEADPEDTQVLHSHSRARKHPPERISEPVVERIIQMRDSPPEGLQWRPGPKAILYYLPAIPTCKQSGCHAPAGRSTASWEPPGRIAHRLPHVQEELARPAPMSHWQVDAEGCHHRAR